MREESTSLTTFDGSKTVAQILDERPDAKVKYGKSTVSDIAKRLQQISGLKPGNSTIRTEEVVEEIIARLKTGETLTSISCEEHLPALRTWYLWCEKDDALQVRYMEAQSLGQRCLADLRMDIAAGGTLSTGDTRRDELLIKTISANIAQRNRREFGERVQHDVRSINVVINQTDDDWS